MLAVVSEEVNDILRCETEFFAITNLRPLNFPLYEQVWETAQA
jgi:hypothetical protein